MYGGAEPPKCRKDHPLRSGTVYARNSRKLSEMPLSRGSKTSLRVHGLIMSLLFSSYGCSRFNVDEESAQTNVMSDVELDDDGKKRTAIRALLAEEHQRSALITGASDKPNSEPGMLS